MAFKLRIVLVPHGKKVEGLTGFPLEVLANPPLTLAGMNQIAALVPKIKALGKFDCLWSSLAARCIGTASVIAEQLVVGIVPMKILTIYTNKDGDTVYRSPEHGHGLVPDDMKACQQQAIEASWEMFRIQQDFSAENAMVLAITHRPIIAGFVGAARGITDNEGLDKVANDPDLIKDGFVVVETTDGVNFTVVEKPLQGVVFGRRSKEDPL